MHFKNGFPKQMTNYAKDIQFLTFLHYYNLYAFSWVFLDVTIFLVL